MALKKCNDLGLQDEFQFSEGNFTIRSSSLTSDSGCENIGLISV
jgi:hypothetical protein